MSGRYVWVQNDPGQQQVLELWIRRAEAAEAAIDAALDELGVPDENTPTPVANAVRLLRNARGPKR